MCCSLKPPGSLEVPISLSTEDRHAQPSSEPASSSGGNREGQAQEGLCTTSSQNHGWHETGIELAFGQKEKRLGQGTGEPPTIDLDFDEARRQYQQTYGKPGSRYEDLFGEPRMLPAHKEGRSSEARLASC